MKTYPVCIIGGGPVGMSLALNLDALGVQSVIVNREAGALVLPRGSTQNARTMEHYRRLGLSAAIRKLGLPRGQATDVVYFTRLDGYEIARLRMPSEEEKMRALEDAGETEQIPEPILRCNQMYVEQLVLDHLHGRPNVTLRYGWTCVAWSEDADGVTVQIEENATGITEKLRCAWIAGCDGAAGIVRQQLKIAYSGEATNTDQAYLSRAMVSTHIRSAQYFRASPHRLGWQNWSLNASFRTNMVSLNGRDELILLTQLPSVEHTPDEALIAQRFHAAVGHEVPFEILGHWKWIPGRALVADAYGRGRAVMAGDSVHLFSPTGGFGMNTGVDDAANLGWKLAALVQGWGGDTLLSSYEEERRPVGIRNTRLSKVFSRHVGTLAIADCIEEDSARGAQARKSAGAELEQFGEEFASIGIQLGARYDGSAIVVSDGSAPPADDPFAYVPSACPGGRAPHLWMADRSSLFDHFGTGFTLLAMTGARESEAKGLADAAAKRGIPLKLLTLNSDAARELYGASLALVRPDQHVAWRGNRLREPDALLASVTGYRF
jgi:2-polyprenyl-6-methoxyphenol hydroxylase-like FAD-dependent oxidoreductase